MDTGSFPRVNSGRGVTLTPHPLLVPWSWKGRAIPLLPYGPYGLYRAALPVQGCTLLLPYRAKNVDFTSLSFAWCNRLWKHFVVDPEENHSHSGQSQLVIRIQDLHNTKHRWYFQLIWNELIYPKGTDCDWLCLSLLRIRNFMNVPHDPSLIHLSRIQWTLCRNENNVFSAPDKKDPVANRGFQIIHGCLHNDVTKSARMYGHLTNLRWSCVKGAGREFIMLVYLWTELGRKKKDVPRTECVPI